MEEVSDVLNKDAKLVLLVKLINASHMEAGSDAQIV
jgi:hypothetical protein